MVWGRERIWKSTNAKKAMTRERMDQLSLLKMLASSMTMVRARMMPRQMRKRSSINSSSNINVIPQMIGTVTATPL